MERRNLTKRLVESAIMIALATVLSMFKLAELPYGGSITFASMLPIVIIAYRHGTRAGLAGGAVYAVMQQLLGLNNLSYFSTWQSIVSIILLDYGFAFTAIGLGGIFRAKLRGGNDPARQQGLELGTGMLLVCVLRYILHVVSGCTVWAGLSIPTNAAFVYSLAYNATYMLPEAIISCATAVWLGRMLDFTAPIPKRIRRTESVMPESWHPVYDFLPHISALGILTLIVADTAMIFPKLQDAETGEFTLAALGEVNWIAVAIVSAIGVLVSAVSLTVYLVQKRKHNA